MAYCQRRYYYPSSPAPHGAKSSSNCFLWSWACDGMSSTVSPCRLDTDHMTVDCWFWLLGGVWGNGWLAGKVRRA